MPQKTMQQANKNEEISFLYNISKELRKIERVGESVEPILRNIANYLGIGSCALIIVKNGTTEIIHEEIYAQSDVEKDGMQLKINSISPTVIKTGEALLLPRLTNQPIYIKSSRDLSHYKFAISMVCIPIKSFTSTMGLIAFNLESYEEKSFKIEFRMLTVIGSMIAHSIQSIQDKAEEIAHLREENLRLHYALHNNQLAEKIIGNSSCMEVVFELIQKVAKTNATVLLRGESGVGKELIANMIHSNSKRVDKPFIKVNCSALTGALLESELFGHEAGAFTGADSQRIGRFEMADGGTIFLDEIGDLSLCTQIKLFRFFQSNEIERIGGTTSKKVDVRIITSTNRNIEEMINKNTFREDLFYNLNVFPITVPSLRERRNDIPMLVDYFIEKNNRRHGLNIKRISTSSIDLMMTYSWPGNIRELENVIERAAILSHDGVIRSNNLPPTLQSAESTGTKQQGSLEDVLANVEKQVIIDHLISSNGCTLDAANSLQITERILRLRLHKYELDPKQYKRKAIKRKLGDAV